MEYPDDATITNTSVFCPPFISINKITDNDNYLLECVVSPPVSDTGAIPIRHGDQTFTSMRKPGHVA